MLPVIPCSTIRGTKEASGEPQLQKNIDMLNIVGHWSQTDHKGARSSSSGTGLRGVHRKQMLKGGGHGN